MKRMKSMSKTGIGWKRKIAGLRVPLAASLVAVAVVGIAGPLPASAEEPAPAFMKRFLAPELVMQNQRAIDLRSDQRKTITKAIQRTQSQTLELQWSIQEAAGRLAEAVGADQIDADAAIAIAEKMMDAEGRVKRAHLRLLIEIRNVLDPDQRRKLIAIRDGQ